MSMRAFVGPLFHTTFLLEALYPLAGVKPVLGGSRQRCIYSRLS
jgi:hypothetical protein